MPFVNQHHPLEPKTENLLGVPTHMPIIHPTTAQPPTIQRPTTQLVRSRLTSVNAGLGVETTRSPESPVVHIVNFRGGQLREFQAQWKKLGAPIAILKIISGYTIPFVAKPPPIPLQENLERFATSLSHVMTKELKNLLIQGVVEKCLSKTGFLSRLFLIPKTNGKLRQIFDLRRLNYFLNPRKFHVINQAQIPVFLQAGDFLGKLDLSQAYFHIPIKESHRRFLAFGYANELFQMTSLPFGLSSAPVAFSRVSKWVAGFMRTKGLRILVYLDDFLFAHQDPCVLRSQMSYAVGLLQSLGWCVNLEKAVLQPTRNLEFLGIVWDTNMNKRRLPEDKIARLLADLENVLQKGRWSWRLGTSLIGRLGFAAMVVPLGRLYTRQIQRTSLKLPENQPNQLLVLPLRAVSDCRWWTLNVKR